MKLPYLALTIFALLFIVWCLFGIFSIRGLESPQYTLVKETDFYEIRTYEPMILASATVEASNLEEATNKGFRLIADYIFGNNTAQAPIAMTTPVTSSVSEPIAMTTPVLAGEKALGGQYTISFVMPSKYTLQNIPRPNNPAVVLVEQPSQTLAVHSFSWFYPEKKVNSKKTLLLEALKADGMETVGEPTAAFYNPPLTPPFMRHNEVWVRLNAIEL